MEVSPGSTTISGRPRRRAVEACTFCRKRKIKCNNEQPTCANCRTYAKDCVYEPLTETNASAQPRTSTRRRQRPMPAGQRCGSPFRSEPRNPDLPRVNDASTSNPNAADHDVDAARREQSQHGTDTSPTTTPRAGVSRIVVSANGVSSYHGRTSALYEDNVQERASAADLHPRMPEAWIEKGLVAEAATQRQLEDFNYQSGALDFDDLGRKFSDEDLEIRRRVFWGAFVVDKIQSLYQGRPVTIKESDTLVPIKFLDTYEEFEHWRPFAYSSESNEYPGSPAYSVSTFTSLCRLSVAMSDILGCIYTERSFSQAATELSKMLETLNAKLSVSVAEGNIGSDVHCQNAPRATAQPSSTDIATAPDHAEQAEIAVPDNISPSAGWSDIDGIIQSFVRGQDGFAAASEHQADLGHMDNFIPAQTAPIPSGVFYHNSEVIRPLDDRNPSDNTVTTWSTDIHAPGGTASIDDLLFGFNGSALDSFPF
ncbi:conserved hypothetical protein [Verticillium alfalfae VaMs.102]|uniref:Zn(2)-C6 fungal-type domain-containing protein n=1 Tax=Verticillium alfalfae (strain VaMs.102 / ATCC MYA-4576 / FGSC 10136) TaxID=526221 RepID=C9SFR4_VERA1|nr:conserved hypothetical protein [Verticillium alfalfae VaMs.102]EEY18009.1 conserved hypothetical protein [Verticillium alfalfae VaMs.102]